MGVKGLYSKRSYPVFWGYAPLKFLGCVCILMDPGCVWHLFFFSLVLVGYGLFMDETRALNSSLNSILSP